MGASPEAGTYLSQKLRANRGADRRIRGMAERSVLASAPMKVFARVPIELWVRYLPLALVVSYLSLTVVLFAFGPWRYPVNDGARVYGFLFLAHLALAVGYLTAPRRATLHVVGSDAVSHLVKVCLAVTLLLLVPTSLLNTGSPVPNIVAGILDPGAVYARSIELRSARPLLTVVAYIRILVGPLLFLLFPLLVVYWGVLSARIRIAGVFALAFVVATYVAMGVNKGIADMLGLFPPLVLVAYLARKLILTRAQWTRVSVGWLVAVFLFLCFFAGTQMTRAGSATEHGNLPAGVTKTIAPATSPSPATTSVTASPTLAVGTATPVAALPTPIATPATFPGGVRRIFVDYDHALVRYLPSGALRTGAVGLSFYVTHGYYALYLSLDKPFVPMFGVGHSIFLTQQAVRVTGNEQIGKLSYPKRIEEDGWDALGLWSSIYPWIASDVSFPGTIVVVFLIGRLFALAWFDALSGRNPFAYGMLAQFAVMFFYFPANNQTSQFGEGFTAFWAILIAWLITRNRSLPVLSRTRTTQIGDPATATSTALGAE
jgi:hypothetical protein